MDNLTHSLFGLTLGRTPLGRTGRGATAALLLASNAPDIDIVTTAGGALNYLQWHRGPTHGPFGVAGLGLVTATLVYFGRRAWDARAARIATDATRSRGRRSTTADDGGDATFLMLWVVSMIGIVCHVLMDLPTSYGTRPLSPFSWRWFAEDWMPIVDVYLLAILAAGLWFGSRSIARARERNAAIVLLLMAANYGVRGVSHHLALAAAPRVFGPLLSQPCADAQVQGWVDAWPRGGADDPAVNGASTAEPCLVEIAALPTFSSPFTWRLVAQLSHAYETHAVNILDPGLQQPPARGQAPRRVSTRYPNIWTPAATAAASARTARVFLGFSRFPSVSSFVGADGGAVVRWRDIRFTMDDGPRRPSRADLFTATIRLDRNGQVVEEKLGP